MKLQKFPLCISYNESPSPEMKMALLSFKGESHVPTYFNVAHSQVIKPFVRLVRVQLEGDCIVTACGCYRNQNRQTKDCRVTKDLKNC